MKPLPRQLNLFFIALAFFTRIPVPQRVEFSEDSLNRASRYFPWVGLLIGALCALVYLLGAALWNDAIGILLAFAAGLLITGGFHEDGLADSFDGFGGGWEKDQVLSIMKDSRLGSFGALALLIVLPLKALALLATPAPALALLAGHTLSRVTAVAFIYREDYVREEGKSKPLAHRMQLHEFMIALAPGVLCLAWLGPASVWLIAPLALLFFALRRYFIKRIGGYTGDCLGAVQQLAELTLYLCLAL